MLQFVHSIVQIVHARVKHNLENASNAEYIAKPHRKTRVYLLYFIVQ